MLLLEGILRAKYYYFCVEFSDFYVNQTLAGQTISGNNQAAFLQARDLD
jgi:hypothetical protein